MNQRLDAVKAERLFKAVLSLKTPEECGRFFDDLCTISELKAMEQRLEVAVMLDRGLVYSRIAEQTGASTATISRVSRSLNYGSDGYRLILDRIKDL